jgi:hypothetical protein
MKLSGHLVLLWKLPSMELMFSKRKSELPCFCPITWFKKTIVERLATAFTGLKCPKRRTERCLRQSQPIEKLAGSHCLEETSNNSIDASAGRVGRHSEHLLIVAEAGADSCTP